ncbi:LysR family transcriptional regulator [Paenibacillus solisilvae]|uniref:LysR family transcriptional regulator n=1 Tax=Paenibacillus solisilvae TaxID=2486751 RepID=A0ABW0VXA0_9BACL
MLNMEWYRIFHQTAKCRNLTKAAEELFITQPSVSYAIKQMETALDMKLFHRLSKGVELTEEGQVLFSYVDQALTLLHAGEIKLQALKRLAGGEVRISASDSLFKHLLLPHLEPFHAAYPEVRIQLTHGKTSDILQRLRDGQTDCGIVHLPVTDPQLEIKPIMTIQDAFVVGSAFKELADQPRTAEELAQTPLLLLSAGSSTRRFVEQWFAACGQTIEADIELGSIDLLVEFARLGYGAAFVTRSFVTEELAAGTLFEVQTAEPIPPRSIGIAMRRERMLPLAAARFVEMFLSSSL